MVIFPITLGLPLQQAILPQQQVQHNLYVQAAWHFRPLEGWVLGCEAMRRNCEATVTVSVSICHGL
jgi:hypothetical protein